MSKTKLILGIDPGYDRCGVCIVDKSKGLGNEVLVFSDCIETDRKDNFYKRLFHVLENIEQIILIYKPDTLAIEKLYFNTNQKTATNVSEIRGAIIYLALKFNLKIKEYTPLQIKSAITSSGKADKRALYEMIPRLIKINKKIKLDDEFDAIATALTCSAVD
jgi:crossover junction endodeoxyribonuclease RuvC